MISVFSVVIRCLCGSIVLLVRLCMCLRCCCFFWWCCDYCGGGEIGVVMLVLGFMLL